MTAAALLIVCAQLFARESFMPELRQAPESAHKPLPSLQIPDGPDWPARRTQLLRNWQAVIGPFPERTPLNARVVSSETLDDHVRTLVRYQTDPAAMNEAFVLTPRNAAKGKLPGVVVLHPTTARTID